MRRTATRIRARAHARALALALPLALLAACPSPAPRLEPEPVPPTPTAPAKPAPEPAPGAAIKARLDRNLTPYIDALGKSWGEAFAFSGIVAVSLDGEIVYSKSGGYRDRATKKPIDADTSFRIGSVTKQFTAAAILELEERGKLATTDTVRKHLPDYPKVGDKITIHHLLTHTSGIPNYTDDAEFMNTVGRGRSVAELIALFSDKPLDFEPGSQFKYSNSGYILLGAIIEKVSGKPYGAFLSEALFTPAGLTSTELGDAAGRDNRARGYTVDSDEALVPARPIDMSVPYAAGGVRSTVRDLIKWDRALAGDKILGEAAKRKLYTPALDDYAYGWRVSRAGGKLMIGHGGGISGFRTDFIRVPEDKLVIVAWSNNEKQKPLAMAALEVIAGKPLPPRPEPKPAPLEAINARRIAGGYVLTEESRGALAAVGIAPAMVDTFAAVFLEVKDGAMYFAPIGQDRMRIHAKAPDSDGFQSDLFAKTDNLSLEVSYEVDDEGRRKASAASGLLVRFSGLEVKFSRDDRRAAKLRADYRRKHPKTKKR